MSKRRTNSLNKVAAVLTLSFPILFGVKNIHAYENYSASHSEYFGVEASHADSDGDGIINYFDNCVLVSNQSQLDQDSDGIGDSCDYIQNGSNHTTLNTVVAASLGY